MQTATKAANKIGLKKATVGTNRLGKAMQTARKLVAACTRKWQSWATIALGRFKPASLHSRTTNHLAQARQTARKAKDDLVEDALSRSTITKARRTTTKTGKAKVKDNQGEATRRTECG